MSTTETGSPWSTPDPAVIVSPPPSASSIPVETFGEDSRGESSWSAATPAARHLSGRVPSKEIASVTSQLSIMLRAGLDLSSALATLSRTCQHPRLRAILREVHREVLEGGTFSAALSRFPRAFGGNYVASVSAGEASGKLSEVLKTLSEFQRRGLQTRGRLQAMMIYPAVLSIVSLAVVACLMLFVLPTFAEIFEGHEAPLPVITRVLVGISAELMSRWWLWVPAVCLLLAGLVFLSTTSKGRRALDYYLLHLRGIRGVTRSLMIGRVCQLLSLMLGSGVPLLESVALIRTGIKNRLYGDLLQQIEVDVTNGRSMSTALRKCSFIPPHAQEMICTAEETGKLPEVVRLIGEHAQEEGELRMRELVALAEPAITVIAGVIVAVIVLSVMLPMYDLTTLTGSH